MLAKVSGVKLPMPCVTIMPQSRVVGIIQDQVLGNLVTKCYPFNEKSTATSDVILNKALTKPAYHKKKGSMKV